MYIFSFDVESNGLHGQGFAVGAVVYDLRSGTVLDSFALRCPIEGSAIDPWVEDNVLPQLADLKLTHVSGKDMRAEFWRRMRAAMADYNDLIVMADFAYPVEARFLAACQDDDPGRAWEAPYPLHDLGTLLLAADMDPDVDRVKWAGLDPNEVRTHHPLDDARVSALCAGICFARLQA